MEKMSRIPHALLISGNEGSAGLAMGLAFAQYLFCSNKQEADACGKCADCHKISKLEHPDLHLTFPVFKKTTSSSERKISQNFLPEFRDFVKHTPFASVQDWLQSVNAENKQGNISVDECDEIINNVYLKSFEGGRKIQLVWMAEYLEKEGNKLLKLIEEPPPDTYLIFIAEQTSRVLSTILSRTQIVRLTPVSAKEIEGALIEKKLADPAKAIRVAAMAGGSFAEALRLVNHAEHDMFPHLRNWFNALATANSAALIKFSEEWAKAGREQQKSFLNYVIQILEESLRIQFSEETAPQLPPEEQAFVQKFAQRNFPFEVSKSITVHVSHAIRCIGQNAHSKTQLLALSIRIQHLLQNDFSLEVPTASFR